MDCVIKIIKGPEEGQEFRCSGNEAVVGRSPRSQVRLSSQTVSFEHAVISRLADEFVVENLSANGTFVNEERITGKVKLRVKDQLRFGQETVGRIEAVPTSVGMASRRRLLWIVAAISITLTIILVIVAGTSTSQSSGNLKLAYPKLDEYVQDQVHQKHLPPQTLDMMHEAWRLEMSRDRADSGPIWRDLNILLSAQEPSMGFIKASSDYPRALAQLSSEDKRISSMTPSDDELKAALIQFVTRMSAGGK